MGNLKDEFEAELEYIRLFSLNEKNELDWLILYIIEEADKLDYTLEKLASTLKVSKDTIRKWIHEPDLLTLKDIINIELLFDISILDVENPYSNETLPGL